MGVISTVKVVTSLETRGRLTLTQPSNREQVTVVKTIRIDGTMLPPMIIFTGKLH